MNNEDIKYAIPACTHLLCLYRVLSLLSTKVGVHVTAVVLRGQSLKMVKPRGDARVFSFLLTSCFDKNYQTAAIRHPGLFSKRFYIWFLWSQASLKQVQLLLHHTEKKNSQWELFYRRRGFSESNASCVGCDGRVVPLVWVVSSSCSFVSVLAYPLAMSWALLICTKYEVNSEKVWN